MIRSMTGFGRAEASDGANKILVEMKAVNHRYLDMNIRLPRRFMQFEVKARGVIKEYTSRGKLDVFVTAESEGSQGKTLCYSQSLAEGYLGYIRRISEELGVPNDVTAVKLASMPEVLTMENVDEDDENLWHLLEKAIRGAGEVFNAQRTLEGTVLHEDITQKLCAMEEMVAAIENRSPGVVEEYRERLTAKVRELLEGVSVDDARILTETAVFADKICVDEETVRLKSHINSMRSALAPSDGEQSGRKLDFIAQEMNREANTILSKCNDMEISGIAVSLKTLIEKIREQVQNIE